MGHRFDLAGVFPIIADVIVRAQRKTGGFVGHDAIVAGLLADSQGAALVARAKRVPPTLSAAAAASMMVKWFSQQITIGRSPWCDFFDREFQLRSWRYRPRTAAPQVIAADIEIEAIEGEPLLFF